MHHAEGTSPFKKVTPDTSLLRETFPYAFPAVALQVPTRGLQGTQQFETFLSFVRSLH
jgi:hypothetical protein